MTVGHDELWSIMGTGTEYRAPRAVSAAFAGAAACLVIIFAGGEVSDANSAAFLDESNTNMKSLIAASAVATQVAISPAFCQDCVLIHSYDFSIDARDGAGTAEGVIMGGASVSGGQLLTDGSSGYVQFSENIIPVGGPFTVAMAYRTRSPSPSGWSEIISQGCHWCPGFSVGRGIYATWRINPITHPGIDGVPYEVGTWHHVAVTSDPSIGRTELWIDGQLRHTHPQAIAMSESGTMTRFARSYGICADGSCGDNGYYHDGMIDCVRIYRGTLGTAQIRQLVTEAECQRTVGGSACCQGDMNGDGQVNGSDIGVLLGFWGPGNPLFPQTDINLDGRVDGADLGVLLANWGPCPH